MSPKKSPEVLLPRLGDKLVSLGHITNVQLTTALQHQKQLKIQFPDQTPPLIGQILVDLNYLEQTELDSAVTDLIINLKNALEESNRKLELRVAERTAELEQAIRKIKELSNSKSEFVSNISHELCTPLTHIMGYTYLLLDGSLGPISPDQKEAIETMKQSSDRLDELIQDLISFTDIENKQLIIQPIPTAPDVICKKAIKGLIEKAQEKNIHLIKKCSKNLPLILADKDKITWVIKQLIDNAIKFTPAGGYVLLKTKKTKDKIDFSVIDTGIGIPEERLNEIFEPFHQLDGSTTRTAGGTGIGLTISKEIIEAHNSKILVLSELQKGTEFRFSLPIDESENF